MANDVINLKRFRKRAATDAKAAQADENRVRFGQSKAERENRKKREDQARNKLEQHRINREEDI